MNATYPLPIVGLPPLPPELAALAGAQAPTERPDDIVRQAFRIGRMRLLAPFAAADRAGVVAGYDQVRGKRVA